MKSDIQLICPRCKSKNIVMTRETEDITNYTCGNCKSLITSSYAIYEFKYTFEYHVLESILSEELLNKEASDGWIFDYKDNDKLIFKKKKQTKVRITPKWAVDKNYNE